MDEQIFNIDLNELPNDEEEMLQFEGNAFVWNDGSSRKEDSMKNEFDPFYWSVFLSEKEAFICFKKYARRNGFSICKDRTDKKK